jgi:hypothetical protein
MNNQMTITYHEALRVAIKRHLKEGKSILEISDILGITTKETERLSK